MTKITATDLKVHGARAIEDALAEHAEAMISVRGRVRYVVVNVDRYMYLKECEQLFEGMRAVESSCCSASGL